MYARTTQKTLRIVIEIVFIFNITANFVLRAVFLFPVAMFVTIKIKNCTFCRWLIPTGSVQSSATAVASTVTFGEVVPCCATTSQRYSTAMSYLQPLASELAEMSPARFQAALLWLESIYQQCMSGEWELSVRTMSRGSRPFTGFITERSHFHNQLSSGEW